MKSQLCHDSDCFYRPNNNTIFFYYFNFEFYGCLLRDTFANLSSGIALNYWLHGADSFFRHW